jgi:hypothetical protein
MFTLVDRHASYTGSRLGAIPDPTRLRHMQCIVSGNRCARGRTPLPRTNTASAVDSRETNRLRLSSQLSRPFYRIRHSTSVPSARLRVA